MGSKFNGPFEKLDTNAYHAKDRAYFLANPIRSFYLRHPYDWERMQYAPVPIAPGHEMFIVIRRGNVERNKLVQLPAGTDLRSLSDQDILDLLAVS